MRNEKHNRFVLCVVSCEQPERASSQCHRAPATALSHLAAIPSKAGRIWASRSRAAARRACSTAAVGGRSVGRHGDAQIEEDAWSRTRLELRRLAHGVARLASRSVAGRRRADQWRRSAGPLGGPRWPARSQAASGRAIATEAVHRPPSPAEGVTCERRATRHGNGPRTAEYVTLAQWRGLTADEASLAGGGELPRGRARAAPPRRVGDRRWSLR